MNSRAPDYIVLYKRVTPISKLCVLREFGSNFEQAEALYEERISGRSAVFSM